MRLGIMQPYFFPYIGYFSLIKNTDKFILFDTPQFIYHGWIERNRVLKQNGGWTYVAVPLKKHSQQTPILEIEIDNSADWKKRILSQLTHYKGSPYYFKTISVVKEALEYDGTSIVQANKAALEAVCRYLEITTPIEVFSDMNLHIDPATSPDEWALNICKAIPGANEYLNPYGGLSFFDREKYVTAGISISFQKIRETIYEQKFPDFQPYLSIIDVMMFNSPQEIRDMLDCYDTF